MMKLILLLTILSCLSSCFQQSNSNTKDSAQVDDSEGVAFKAAFTVLNNECIQCHSGYHDDWSRYSREADWLAVSDLIISGDANNSYLVKRIHECGSIDSEKQMPKDSDVLTLDECAAITDWINNLEQ
jgi:hypothetical protein